MRFALISSVVFIQIFGDLSVGGCQEAKYLVHLIKPEIPPKPQSLSLLNSNVKQHHI